MTNNSNTNITDSFIREIADTAASYEDIAVESSGGNILPPEQTPAATTHSSSSFGFAWTSISLFSKNGISVLGGDDVVTVLQLLTDSFFPGATVDYRGVWAQGPFRQVYKRVLTGPCKAWLGAAPVTSPSGSWRNHLHVELPDAWVTQIALPKYRALLRKLSSLYEVRSTRLDLAFDNCPFTVKQVWRACKRGDIRCACNRPRPGDDVEKRPFRHLESLGELKGQTVYVGRPAAARMLRIYDYRGSTRLELQCRHKRAELALDLFSGGQIWGDRDTKSCYSNSRL